MSKDSTAPQVKSISAVELFPCTQSALTRFLPCAQVQEVVFDEDCESLLFHGLVASCVSALLCGVCVRVCASLAIHEKP